MEIINCKKHHLVFGGEKLSGTTRSKPFLSAPTEEHTYFIVPHLSPEPCLFSKNMERDFSGSISVVGCWWEAGPMNPPGLGVELVEMFSASELSSSSSSSMDLVPWQNREQVLLQLKSK